MKEKEGGAEYKRTSKLVNQPAATSLLSARKIKHTCMRIRDIKKRFALWQTE